MSKTREEKKQIIEKGLKDLLTAKEIGRLLGGLSRQRVYQLMDQFGLAPNERKRHGFWKTQDDKSQWLHRTLNSKIKHIDKPQRLEVFEELSKEFPTNCPILGIPLVYGNEGTRKDDSASIDRLDSSKPYGKGNVSIISWRANRIKNDGTFEEHKKLIEWWEKNM